MADQLQEALLLMAERGRPAGASVVVERAMTEAAATTDEHAFTVPPTRQTVRPSPRRRLAPRRLLAAGVATMVLIVAAAGGGWLYLRSRIGDVRRINVTSALDVVPQGLSGEPTNILLVGSDSRARVDPSERDALGSAAIVRGARADLIMILRIDQNNRRVSLLSLPRDLVVATQTGVDQQRLSTIFTADAAGTGGGAAALIEAIRNSVGIPINHYAEIDFTGFRQIVSALGGVSIPFAAPARDVYSGLNVPQSGCVRLDGDQALAFVRSRHYQSFAQGRWQDDGGGDIARIQRQQQLLTRLSFDLPEIERDPRRLNQLLDAVVDNVTLDATMTRTALVQLAGQLERNGVDDVRSFTIPTMPFTVNNSSGLALDPTNAQPLVEQFLDNAPSGPQDQHQPAIGDTQASDTSACR